jgi:hypothetical protein
MYGIHIDFLTGTDANEKSWEGASTPIVPLPTNWKMHIRAVITNITRPAKGVQFNNLDF